MIDGSEKRNRQLGFELQNSHVCEKRSKIGTSFLSIDDGMGRRRRPEVKFPARTLSACVRLSKRLPAFVEDEIREVCHCR